jgi:Coenzyme PQQ synthesis protein D (PqqD).
MKFNNKYKIWKLGDESVIIENSTSDVNLSHVYKLNETSIFLWESIGGKEFSEEDLIRLLCDEYDVQPDIAKRDVHEFIDQMKSYGFII